MKKLFLFLASIVFVVACTENEPDGGDPTPQPQKPSITIAANTVSSFNDDGGESLISFTASEAWSAEISNSSDNDWLSIYPTSGVAGNATITLTVEPNDAPDDRSASIVIKAGSASKSITISQKQMDVLTVTASETVFGAEGGNIEVVVEANVDFDYVIDEEASEWITYEGTRALETNTLVFAVGKNDTDTNRSSTIIFTSKDGYISQEISVYQGGISKIYYTSSDGNIVTPRAYADWGGAKIVSNTYENGQGVITFDNRISMIPNKAFYDCSSLTSIDIPEYVAFIEFSSFENCTSLTKITLPEGILFIADNTFWGCTSLTGITIPESVREIYGYAFGNCTSLTSITFSESVGEIEQDGSFCIGQYAFYNCTSLTNVILPKNTGWVRESAFFGCTSLANVTLHEGVYWIGSYAFSGCSSLANITIPESVERIDNKAFSGCQKLTAVYCKPITPPALGEEAFDGNATGRKIYVPNVSINEYYNGNGWGNYRDAIQGYDF